MNSFVIYVHSFAVWLSLLPLRCEVYLLTFNLGFTIWLALVNRILLANTRQTVLECTCTICPPYVYAEHLSITMGTSQAEPPVVDKVMHSPIFPPENLPPSLRKCSQQSAFSCKLLQDHLSCRCHTLAKAAYILWLNESGSRHLRLARSLHSSLQSGLRLCWVGHSSSSPSAYSCFLPLSFTVIDC